ncbi:hypothetical protein M2171_005370 [Bradyrhizobium japonicum USDA 38]|nr:hypothetical protein [Bradyrhizobium japonicum USDA 38]MCS3948751.1 hypothetical protein [Bradyrhizobium japonicum]MCW2218517.1 hypothetical protein [Bradyrhizobium japonicum]MCW2343131.1 hypothetical protein [Bradyrhizobium japonicum]
MRVAGTIEKKSEQEFSAERLEAFHKVKHPDAG